MFLTNDGRTTGYQYANKLQSFVTLYAMNNSKLIIGLSV